VVGVDAVVKVQRLPDNPIITLAMGDKRDLEGNINGPSLIRVPDWIENPLGRYYLYFAHHNGTYIRLAYADEVAGPWQVYAPGTLKLEEAYAIQHVASPDVHVDNDRREIRMYYHSPVPEGGQRTKVATSEDGIRFTAAPEVLGLSYFRVFQWDGWHYAIGMPGVLYRSKDGLTDFQQRPTLFPDNIRHCAVKLDGNALSIYYSMVGEAPESIYQSSIDLTPDWMSWKPTDQQVMLRPELGYEGADLPNEPSQRGAIMEPVNQLRDPCIFEDGNNTYLLYSIAGEQGIALAKLSE
jgi:hypothetical protein